jgi:N-methylhydantoinase B/oxoprolinase/acetone carboxylase alpha subunit
MSTNQNVDELETQVLWNRLHATADEMFETARRLSFSLSIQSGGDASAAVMTPDGKAIGISDDSIPVFAGALSRSTQIILEEHFPPSELAEGDIIITNDPWIGGGHLSDFLVLNPVFQDKTLVGLTAMFGHTDDVGGNPGGWSTDDEQVFQEGVLIPPTKFYAAGKRNDTVEAIIRNNVRLPDEAMGDLEALRSGALVGEERIQEAVSEYGHETFVGVTDEILDRSEQVLRERLAELPDATHEEQMQFEIEGFPLTVSLAISIDGDDIYVDFEGTSDQIPAGVNCPFGNIRSVTAYIMKCMLVPELLNAEGIFRPLNISAPEASIVNAQRPIATMARNTVYSRVEDLVTQVLSQFVPGAGLPGMGGIQISAFNGQDPRGNPFMCISVNRSGFPPRADSDGDPGVFFPYNGTQTPVEVWEQYTPLHWVETSLVADTEGAGEYRSSPAMRSTIRNPMDQEVHSNLTSDRGGQAPAGIRGGHDGKPSTVESSIEDKTVPVNGATVLEPGEEQSIISATCGGYGDPTDRKAEYVEDDILKGLVSESRAREVYGYEPNAGEGG